MEFYLFKTNVSQDYDIHELSPYLNGVLENGKWHFDLEDCDKVLCIRCAQELKPQVERMIRIRGYVIEELHYLESELKRVPKGVENRQM